MILLLLLITNANLSSLIENDAGFILNDAHRLVSTVAPIQRTVERGWKVRWHIQANSDWYYFSAYNATRHLTPSWVPGQSVTLGHYAVNRHTGEVWEVVPEQRIDSPDLVEIQKILRNAYGCDPEIVAYWKSRGPAESVEPKESLGESTTPAEDEAHPSSIIDDLGWQEIEYAFVEEDQVAFEDYLVERKYLNEHEVEILLSEEGDSLLQVRGVGGAHFNKFGFFRLLGGESREQLVLMRYTGGAHCCWQYWIYHLGENPSLIFKSEDYPVGYPLRVADLNDDGVFEISQSVMTFDYFPWNHATAPFPRAIFQYDETRRRYLPANINLASFYLEDEVQKHLDRRNSYQKSEGWAEMSAFHRDSFIYGKVVLQVVLDYIYAGKWEKGWEMFDRDYEQSTKEATKVEILEMLVKDSFYQAVAPVLDQGRRTSP